MDIESQTKVLVTGGAGFIASHLVDRLIAKGYETVVVDNLFSGKADHVNKLAKLYKVDITDPLQISKVFEREKPQVVAHYAAQTSVTRSIRDPSFDAAVNIVGSLNVFEAAKKFKVRRVVLASTGGAIYGDPQKLPCREDDPVCPLAPYGISKLTMEHFSNNYQPHDFSVMILRLGNVYGPRQDPEGEAGVVAIFAGRMLSDSDVVVYGDGEQQRDFIYVDDVVEASMKALFSKERGVYNIACNAGVSVNTIVERLRRIVQWEGEVLYKPTRQGEVFRIVLSSAKALNILGWKAVVSLDQGLRETVEYLQNYEI